ncbi:radical SAM protein [Kosakonia oryzae]|uniref:radical SAM protein n=1 Tax=Kosakonia oryzae TaxID=497725 RepID=UPI001D07498C|nr:radical SAM protein [Kosakonia oryzae]UDJ84672.1 radical SAM protein [Kosakonia oryzae]
MSLPEYFTPDLLTVISTNRCTAECKHCCMNSGFKRKEKVSTETALITIKKLHELFHIKCVVFAGGEPTLHKDLLSEAIPLCKSLGINSRLITNASWASNYGKTKKYLHELYESGLDELNISFDDYHAKFIDPKNIVNAWNASKEINFKSVYIANSQDYRSKITSSYIMNLLGENLPLRFDDDGKSTIVFDKENKNIGISNSKIMYLFKGMDEIDPDLPHFSQTALYMPCHNIIKRLALNPFNHIIGCCGFELKNNEFLDFGPVDGNDLQRLLIDASDDIIIKALYRFGPGFLLRYAARYNSDIKIRKNYNSICEVCYDLMHQKVASDFINEHCTDIAKILFTAEHR